MFIASFDHPTKRREQFAVNLRKQKVDELIVKRRRFNNNAVETKKKDGSESSHYKGVELESKEYENIVEAICPGVLKSNLSLVMQFCLT